MKRMVIYTLLYLLVSCSLKEHETNNIIRRIKVSFSTPANILSGKGIGDSISIFVNYSGNYIIYELPYHKTLQEKNKLIYDSIKYNLLFCNSENHLGFYLANEGDKIGKKINCDSILVSRAFYGGFGFPQKNEFTKDSIPVIVSSEKDQSIYRYKYNGEFYDSAYFTYKKYYKDFEFIFIKHYDSIYNSKLSKIQLFIRHDKKLDENPELKNFFITSYEMKDEPIKNEKEIKQLFDRFIEFDKGNSK